MATDPIEERLHKIERGWGLPAPFTCDRVWLIAQVRALRQRVVELEQQRDGLAKVTEDLLDSLEADHYNATNDTWDEESAATSAYDAREALRAHEPPAQGREEPT